ncbi:MAG: glycerate kinase [Nitrospirota bacterium]|nr:glycerate kinase [Nitrospirota bacterium]MDH5574139.1 glycerate kinase [Nitrospirota bacterium]
MKTSPIRIHYPDTRIKSILNKLITAAIQAADPQKALRGALIRKGNHLKAGDLSYDLSRFRRIVCVGAGKASGQMAMALEQVLGDSLEDGIVIVKDGYGVPCKKIRILEAAHPVPDGRGVKATKQILSLVQSLTQHDLVIVLLSGGASSLLCAPSARLTLIDKQRTTRLLLRSGATIHDMNVVRKHLSAIKGGQLAHATPATILTLIISDVLGDDLAAIGSGPTVPDSSTYQDAIDILKHYEIWTKVPVAVQRHFKKGLTGRISETLKPTRRRTLRNRHIVLANNHHAIEGVAIAARRLKFTPFLLPIPLQGEAKEIGSILGGFARDLVEFGNPVPPPACLIAGGEPTVTVKGKGKGGRAQECVLAAVQELAGLRKVFVAGFGTDGTDGPTEVAGALADGKTSERASRKELDLSRFLDNHDSYHFFKNVGGHIITGPTGTNVNDIYLIVVL